MLMPERFYSCREMNGDVPNKIEESYHMIGSDLITIILMGGLGVNRD